MRNGNKAIYRQGHDVSGTLGSLGSLPAMEMVAAHQSARRLAYLLVLLLVVAWLDVRGISAAKIKASGSQNFATFGSR